jgi:tetratricopeptide (TPR) repeat protein
VGRRPAPPPPPPPRRQLARVPLPDDVDPRELDHETRKQLMSLSKDTADLVARHLVMAGRLMDEEPQQALAHARAARALAGRVGAVREASGLVAYTAGEWAEALTELRTARRLTGDPEHLPVMADCERALGRPDRALLVTEDPQAKGLSPAARVELMIVASGARRDQGQAAAAVVSLQVPALEGPVRAWTARLRYAYADALLDAGREDDARAWFGRAAEVDERGETDADERILELDGMVFADLHDGDDDGDDDGGEDTSAESGDTSGAESPEIERPRAKAARPKAEKPADKPKADPPTADPKAREEQEELRLFD